MDREQFKKLHWVDKIVHAINVIIIDLIGIGIMLFWVAITVIPAYFLHPFISLVLLMMYLAVLWENGVSSFFQIRGTQTPPEDPERTMYHRNR